MEDADNMDTIAYAVQKAVRTVTLIFVLGMIAFYLEVCRLGHFKSNHHFLLTIYQYRFYLFCKQGNRILCFRDSWR